METPAEKAARKQYERECAAQEKEKNQLIARGYREAAWLAAEKAHSYRCLQENNSGNFANYVAIVTDIANNLRDKANKLDRRHNK